MKKRVLSAALSLCMLLTLLPMLVAVLAVAVLLPRRHL